MDELRGHFWDFGSWRVQRIVTLLKPDGIGNSLTLGVF